MTLHKQGHTNPNYYRITKFLNDYTVAYEENGYSTEEINQNKLNIKGRVDRE